MKDLVVFFKMSDGVFGTVHRSCPDELTDSDKNVAELQQELGLLRLRIRHALAESRTDRTICQDRESR